ncbi:MAG: NUDIX hydrolase [bacterium]|nr:NUDIX hydrolase [bacterium]
MKAMADQKLLAVSSIVVNPDGKVLLRKRTKDPDQGKWELIAGYVNPGERLTEAVERRLRDKAGIGSTDSIEFTGKYYDDPDRHPDQPCIPLTFVVKTSEPGGGEENELQWFDPSEIDGLEIALDNKQVIRDAGAV